MGVCGYGPAVHVLLWVVQVLLALHTVMGAVWKFSNSAQAVPSLRAIPHGAWLAMSVLELVCAAGLVVPARSRRLSLMAPVAAGCIAAEMLLFCGVHVASGEGTRGQLVYWIGVAVISALLGYGRLTLRPRGA